MKSFKIIRAKELAESLGISIPTLWRMEKKGQLPPKIKISDRVSGWRETDILDWLKKSELQNNQVAEV